MNNTSNAESVLARVIKKVTLRILFPQCVPRLFNFTNLPSRKTKKRLKFAVHGNIIYLDINDIETSSDNHRRKQSKNIKPRFSALNFCKI